MIPPIMAFRVFYFYMILHIDYLMSAIHIDRIFKAYGFNSAGNQSLMKFLVLKRHYANPSAVILGLGENLPRVRKLWKLVARFAYGGMGCFLKLKLYRGSLFLLIPV